MKTTPKYNKRVKYKTWQGGNNLLYKSFLYMENDTQDNLPAIHFCW